MPQYLQIFVTILSTAKVDVIFCVNQTTNHTNNDVLYRWIWYIPCLGEFLHTLCHVYLLRSVISRTTLPKISLVEKVYDNHADCMFFSISTIYSVFV